MQRKFDKGYSLRLSIFIGLPTNARLFPSYHREQIETNKQLRTYMKENKVSKLRSTVRGA